MKTIILAVLLLLAVASTVFGDITENDEVFGDMMESDDAVEDDKVVETTTIKGMSQDGDEIHLPLTLHTLQLYKIASLLNYELRMDV
jgi:hypothetical protein